MSAIPPHLPALRPSVPAPAPAAPTPAARADFFKVALANAQAGIQVAAQPAALSPRPPAGTAPVAPEDRPARPGTLLDIRV